MVCEMFAEVKTTFILVFVSFGFEIEHMGVSFCHGSFEIFGNLME